MGGGALRPWQFVAKAIELDFVFTGELLGEVNHRMGELPRLWRSGGINGDEGHKGESPDKHACGQRQIATHSVVYYTTRTSKWNS